MTIATENSKPDETDRVYRLGDIVFTMRNCNEHYKDAVEKLLPRAQTDPTKSSEVTEINTGCNKEFLALIHHIANLHHKEKCVWIEASCLLTPAGEKVLIAGKAQSGKSTTAMTLAVAYNWRVLSENLCIIDYGAKRLPKFLAPASFDQNGLDVLKAINVIPPDTFALEWRKDRVWAPVKGLSVDAEFEPTFDLAFWLERNADSTEEFSATEVTGGEFARKALTISNLLKIKGSYDCFLLESLASADCWIMSGGELERRVQTILEATTALQQSQKVAAAKI